MLAINLMLKLEEDWLKNRGHRLFMKQPFFVFLVRAFYKEHITVIDFDHLYLESYVEFC